jgi:hypothetical protein
MRQASVSGALRVYIRCESCPPQLTNVACDERTTDAVDNSFSPLRLPVCSSAAWLIRNRRISSCPATNAAAQCCRNRCTGPVLPWPPRASCRGANFTPLPPPQWLSFRSAPTPPTPQWAFDQLEKDYKARLESLVELASALQSEGHKGAPPVKLAQAGDGLSYTGRMAAVTALHLLQEEQEKRFLVHARALVQDRPFRAGLVQTVSYAYERGKIVPLETDRIKPDRPDRNR